MGTSQIIKAAFITNTNSTTTHQESSCLSLTAVESTNVATHAQNTAQHQFRILSAFVKLGTFLFFMPARNLEP